MWSARTKWKDIGLELDIIQTDLDAIEAAHRSDIGRCLIEMLALWLKQIDPPPTWSTLVAALHDPTIEEGT
ncbi:MAG: death domain-containing protein, partial [Proteobacteria bacterium]|nr:death domain-containing protein [Pseudomonadota bacterium]